MEYTITGGEQLPAEEIKNKGGRPRGQTRKSQVLKEIKAEFATGSPSFMTCARYLVINELQKLKGGRLYYTDREAELVNSIYAVNISNPTADAEGYAACGLGQVCLTFFQPTNSRYFDPLINDAANALETVTDALHFAGEYMDYTLSVAEFMEITGSIGETLQDPSAAETAAAYGDLLQGIEAYNRRTAEKFKGFTPEEFTAPARLSRYNQQVKQAQDTVKYLITYNWFLFAMDEFYNLPQLLDFEQDTGPIIKAYRAYKRAHADLVKAYKVNGHRKEGLELQYRLSTAPARDIKPLDTDLAAMFEELNATYGTPEYRELLTDIPHFLRRYSGSKGLEV